MSPVARWQKRPDARRNRIGRLILKGFAAALLLLLIGQGILLTTGLSLTLPIPDILFQKLTAHFAKRAITLQARSSTIDLTGHVSLSNVRLSSSHEALEISFHCDALYLRLDLSQLLLGKVAIDHLTIDNAVLFDRKVQSNFGPQDPLFDNLSARFDRENDLWHIRYLTLFIDNLHMKADGEIASSLDPPSPLEPSEYFDTAFTAFSETLTTLSQRLAALKPLLKDFRDPQLHLSFTRNRNAPDAIKAHFRAESFHTAQGLHGGPLSIRARGNWQRPYQPFQTVWLSAESVSLPLSAWLRSFLPSSAPVAPTNTLVADPVVEHSDIETLHSLYGRLDLSERSTLTGFLAGYAFGDPLELHAHFDTQHTSGVLTFSGPLTPAKLRARPWAANSKALKKIDLSGAPYIKLTVPLNSRTFLEDAKFYVEALAAEINNFQARHLQASGTITSQKLDCTFRYHNLPHLKGTGRFTQTLATNDYRLLFEGKLHPQYIASWIKGNWWMELWDGFTFEEDPPSTNIDLKARWGNAEKTTIYTAVEVEAFSYRTLPIEHAYLNIYFVPGFLEIANLHAKRPEGVAAAHVKGYAIPVTGPIHHLDFTITSTFDPYEAAVILNPDWQATLNAFTFTQPPRLEFKGRHYVTPTIESDKATVAIALHTEAPLYYRNIPLDCLFLEAMQQGPVIDFKRLDFDLADGQVEAVASLSYGDSHPHLDLEANLTHADFPKLLLILSQISPHTPTTQYKKDIPPPTQGALDLTIKAQGRYDTLKSFEGDGTFTLRSKSLTTLHLLGPLSHFLKKTPLPNGTLQFTQAASAFTLNKGHAHFPQLLVTGPNATIDASGQYALVENTLDFQAKLYFLPQLGLNPLLSPLASVLEFTIDGSLYTPNWQFQYGPRNLFNTGRESLIKRLLRR